MTHLTSWLNQFFDRFTYSGKIRFVGGMVLSLCIFCIGMVLYLQHDLIKMYNSKVTGISQHHTLSSLLKSSCDLQLLVAVRSSGGSDNSDAIVQATANIDRLLNVSFSTIQKDPHSDHLFKTRQILETNNQVELLASRWKSIHNDISENSHPPLLQLRRFNRHILDMIKQNIQTYRLDQGIEMIIFAVTNVAVERLPALQNQLTYLATTAPELNLSVKSGGSYLLQGEHSEFIRRKLREMENMVNQAINENIIGEDDFDVQHMMDYFTPYSTAVDKYLADIATGSGEKNTIRPSAKEALVQGWKTEELLLKNLESNLQYALHVLNTRKYTTILITVAGFLIFLTMYLTRLMRRPLEMLKSAATSLSGGDLSVRVPVTVNDEVSKIIIAFNEMASTWEDSVFQAKMVTDRLVDISTSVFDSASNLEDNVASQQRNIESMKVQAKMVAANIQNFKEVLGEVNTSACTTSAQAEYGRHSLTEMEDVTRQMGSAARLIVDTLSLIEGQVERIKGILNTTVSIADQSNLLSLNTAIRANQTGSTGGGFAVVAGKIRELAEQIAFATLDIEKAVHEIVGDVTKAIVEVENFSSQISGQVDDEKHVHEIFTQRINQTQEQIRTFDAINTDMEQLFKDTLHIDGMINGLAKVSAETEKSVRKLYGDAERLSNKTGELQTMIARFRLKA